MLPGLGPSAMLRGLGLSGMLRGLVSQMAGAQAQCYEGRGRSQTLCSSEQVLDHK